MARRWTEAQLNAINALEGNVLVSAAAGSGKTAVLTQRVINRLTQGENPTSADRLLIVTFTKAAAGEMRQRISDTLEAMLKKDPYNTNLINQQLLLPTAKICTIDSFCYDLVKENFQQLSLSADFKIGDEGEIEILSKQAMDITMENMYKGDDNGDFKALSELIFSGRDDSKTADMAEKLYKSSVSFPFPEKWLDSLCEEFSCEGSLKDSSYGRVITENADRALAYASELAEGILWQCMENEEYSVLLYDAVSSDKAQIDYIREKIKNDCWDEIRRSIMVYSPARRKNTPAHLKEDYTLKVMVQNRDEIKSQLKALAEDFCCSEEEYKQDMAVLSPMIKALCSAAKEYRANFSRLKKEKKLADFSDITHFALSLLVKETQDGYESTQLACSLRDNFDEILIDEYQDTNAAQDMLFTTISRNNLFRVGDVKQSIYRFRQANPDIFIGLKNTYELYDKEKKNYPAKIILGNNFRSRKGVTDIINFVFSQIMSSGCGDIEYNSEEELVFSAGYSEDNQSCAELHLLEVSQQQEEEKTDNVIAEADYISDLILSMIDSGLTVSRDGEERKATYKDFAVLMRSMGSDKGIKFAEVFRNKGIPCFMEVSGEFLTSKEIGLVLNLLRVIDNPKQDIPLLSVMMSPIFGFTADDMAGLRLSGKKEDIYTCILNSRHLDKVNSFLEKINGWRQMSVCLRVRELLEQIYTDTALPCIFGAVDTSGVKTGNLMLLCDYADIYEESGYGSVSGFIGFIDRLNDKKRDISGSVGTLGDSNCVRIMTIHKSKGLEFPVCILAGCSGTFNKSDEKENLVISQKHGIGVIRRDIDTFEQYPTVCHKSVKLSIGKDNISEEMRVLYVAMTRAREKLIMVYTKKDIPKQCSKYAAGIPAGKSRFSPYAVSCATGYGEWLLKCFLRHPDATAMREAAEADGKIVLPTESRLKVVMAEYSGYTAEEKEYQAVPEADEDFLQLIKERSEFRYKYEALSGVITKRAASETDKNFVDRDYFASSAPEFLSPSGLTGAARGVATHTFIQYADYDKAQKDVGSEIERLLKKGILSTAQAQAINIKAVSAFFSSSLFERIKKSPKVMREKKFTVEVPISEVYEGLNEFSQEMMMIQGIADCAFLEDGELVVVDYKTDRLDSVELFKEKYASQVLIYKKALKMATGYSVKQTLLYSFYLGKEIEVEGK